MLENWIEKYNDASNKLVLLDYDGTLVNFSPVPGEARPSDRVLNLLLKLNNNQGTEAVVITGREYQDIDNLIGHLPINIVAEHGAMIKENTNWTEQVQDDGFWKEEILFLLERTAKKCPGSFVEEKQFSLTWHYRGSEEQAARICSRELLRNLNEKIVLYDLKIIEGNKVIEVVNNKTNKGIAALHLLQKGRYDFVVSIGDDRTDEDMFKALTDEKRHLTIKVGDGETSARHRLHGVNDVLSFLEQVIK